MKKTVVVSLLFSLVTAGCADPDVAGPGIDSEGAAAQEAGSKPHQPVAVRGLDSCAQLPTRASKATLTGERLPQLELPCLVPGPAVNLAELGGRPVLVNLWATWCGPCREEMPILQRAHETYGDEVQFLGVNTKDSPQLAATFLQDVGVTYPQVVDLDAELLTNHLRVPGLPVTVALDSRGRVSSRHVGPLDEESLDDLLGEMVSG